MKLLHSFSSHCKKYVLDNTTLPRALTTILVLVAGLIVLPTQRYRIPRSICQIDIIQYSNSKDDDKKNF